MNSHSYFPTVKEVIVDGTERPICRPKDSEKQKEYFSGKKKRHTSKNLAAASKDKKVLVLTPSTTGKTHDKKIQDHEDIIGGIPDEIPVLAETRLSWSTKTICQYSFATQETERRRVNTRAKTRE